MAKGRLDLDTPGKSSVGLPVTRVLGGGDIKLWANVARGSSAGPTFTLLSGAHGSEWFSIGPLKRLFDSIDVSQLAGTLVVVPVMNSTALRQHKRNLPGEADNPDFNRIYPGKQTWLSDQTVSVLCEEVLNRSTHVLDHHPGPWGSAFSEALVADDLPGAGLSDEVERLSLAYGLGMMRRTPMITQFPGPGSSVGYVGAVLGLPALHVALGGSGFGPVWEEQWGNQTFWGTLRVMRELGMIPDAALAEAPAPADRVFSYRNTVRANPTVGGFLRPKYGPEDMGREVSAGEVLGEVADPATFQVLEEIKSPVDGRLTYVSRAYPVDPGDWAYGVAAADDQSRWIERV